MCPNHEVVCGLGGLSGLRRGDGTFGRLGLQGQPDGSSVGNIFEGSFTGEGTGSGKAIFEGGFKFAASEARKKFDSTASPSTQEYQKLECKLKQDLTDQGTIGV